MKSTFSRGAARRRGQTLVETALILTAILLPLTLGLLQYGVYLNATNTMTQIAREGGRYAALHGTESTSDAAIRTYVRSVATNTSISATDLTDARIVITPSQGNSSRVSGNPIVVSVTYPMAKKVFVGSFLSNLPGIPSLKRDYTAESTFIIE